MCWSLRAIVVIFLFLCTSDNNLVGNFCPATEILYVCSEKVDGVHQLSSPAGDEEWKIRPGLQTVPEDDPSGESQAGHPGQQLPSSQVYPCSQ